VVVLYGLIAAGLVVSQKLVTFMKSRESAVDVRLHQYTTTWQMIRDHPLFGVGLNNSTGVKREYERASRWGIDPTAQSGDEPIHSYYLTLIAEVGLVGFACYMAFWGLVVRRLLRLSRAGLDTEISMYATALAIGIIGLGVGVLTDPFYEDGIESLLWTYAGLALVLERMNGSEAPVVA
jgi:O-antigen ligase